MTRPRCSAIAPASSSADSVRPAATQSPFRKTLAPRTVICSPSDTSSKIGAPGASISRTPPRTSRSGPGFGKRPLWELATLTTTRTPHSSSSSAETRSRSVWSMTATSPGPSRRTRFFVRRSSFAAPVNSMKLVGAGIRQGKVLAAGPPSHSARRSGTPDRRASAGSPPAGLLRRAARCECGSDRRAVSPPGSGGRRGWRSAGGG